MTAPARGGRGEGGGGGWQGGEGGEGEGGGEGGRVPQIAQIHWRRRNFTAGPWGSFMGSHREGPPPAPTMVSLGVGQWGGD